MTKTQNTIDTLLSFKVDDSKMTKTINLIGSYEDSINIPGINNKIAYSAVQSKIGEVAELISHLPKLS